MYITVKLLDGYKQPLTYLVPDTWATKPVVGSVVHVPIRTRKAHAVVIETRETFDVSSFTIKPALALEPFPADSAYYDLITKLGTYYQIDPFSLVQRLKQFLAQKNVKSRLENQQVDVTISEDRTSAHTTLTNEQQAVVDFVTPSIVHPTYTPTLLHGVTGSGKTEVYAELIKATIEAHKSVILLLPEVTLAGTFQAIFKRKLPHVPLFGFHSASSASERRQLWQHACTGTPMLVIGVHLPALLPLSNLGLIIVDEEHEVGFQEKKHPKINSKEAALIRAQLTKIPIVLGSATPSMSSLDNVERRGWHLFKLTQRFLGTLPTVTTVLLSEQKKRPHFWISKQLYDAIAQRLARHEQSIMFLNRRGHSFFLQCSACSFVTTCTQCAVSLTVHQDKILRCHYCDYQQPEPTSCLSCGAPESALIKKGIGTQQLVTILQKLFPTARIARADLDVTINRKAWQKTVTDMHQGTIDILVGTQTITKGYHFPRVTLVGVIWADLSLNIPLYNAAETTVQQLIQVAGRAGRSMLKGEVIIQAMMNHPAFASLSETDYLHFCQNEYQKRALLGYPPAQRLIEIELKNTNAHIVDEDAQALAQRLRAQAPSTIQILGPAQPLVSMIKNIHSRKIYLKGSRIDQLITLYVTTKKDDLVSSIFFTPQPLTP